MRHWKIRFVKAWLIVRRKISDRRSIKNQINMYIIVIYEDLDIDHLPSQVINGQC